MTRKFMILAIVAILVAFAIREIRLHRAPAIGDAFAGAQGVTVWNSRAQVRVPVTTLSYGQPLEVVERQGDDVEVRTANGEEGWVAPHDLLDAAVWRDASLLNAKTSSMPVEASGQTRARTNLHVTPGRDTPVILQLLGRVPVNMLERKVAPRPVEHSSSANVSTPSLEDWWLVRADTRDSGEVSGWLLGRFVDLNLPDAIEAHESSEGYNAVAWFEINRAVADSGEVKPEYLVLGTRGPEGQPCDFSVIRVYTWSPLRSLYETAYIENNICGDLPVDVTPASRPGGEASFRFRAMGMDGPQTQEYRMLATTVRRVRAQSAKNGRAR
jgi:Bacterial SH3 domain